MPSFNHSYICAQLMRQFLLDESLQPMPDLTLDIESGMSPDISVFRKEEVKPDFFEDILKAKKAPVLAVEVMGLHQSIQEMLDSAKLLLKAWVKAVWIVEPYARSVFVLSGKEQRLFHQELVETEGIRVDFAKVFFVERWRGTAVVSSGKQLTSGQAAIMPPAVSSSAAGILRH
ncbi:Uma2 family endonuclease [Candidatus Electronema sp. TJ]|uniref:Uma2 family endonuclease n=1 Tax=Candidatus Electronema sp. TJ TaxID=3401573 RepID=UPI003AA9A6B8